MKIRPLAKADYEEWRVLWVSYLDFYETSLKAEVIDETFSRFIDNDQIRQNALVAENKGDLAGLVHYIFHLDTWGIREVCYLQDLFVIPQNRGKKIGQLLIQGVYERADKYGAPSVYWLTQKFNVPARKLYDRLADLTPFIHYERRNKL
jgi:GNAT superfamily N-acetyltransferase